jgi:23S rRNA (cytidine1920-2'-O)/16S rRNA (cytidine1409-2'-O)-methyltransferase
MTDGPVGGVVADLSFVSLKVALGPALALVEPGGWLVALVKPQFEVGRSGVGRGGIVRDAALREAAVRDIVEWLQNSGWQVTGQRPSPIAGGSGNIEILVGARRRHREAKDRHDRG